MRQVEFDDEARGKIEDEARGRGIELTDNCGRDSIPATSYRNGDLASTTTDALSLFLREADDGARTAWVRAPPPGQRPPLFSNIPGRVCMPGRRHTPDHPD